MILRKGVVVELGPTEKVFGNPQHAYTKLLLDSVPQLHTKWDLTAPRTNGGPPEPVADTPTLVEVEPGHFAASG
jgi:peptide/nickel transport system ATP-binding protein